MSPNLEEFKHQGTFPTNKHSVTYNLQLRFYTYENDGETISKELEEKEEAFNAMEPIEQIQFLLKLATDLAEDDEIEYEAIQSVDISRMLRTTFKAINKGNND